MLLPICLANHFYNTRPIVNPAETSYRSHGCKTAANAAATVSVVLWTLKAVGPGVSRKAVAGDDESNETSNVVLSVVAVEAIGSVIERDEYLNAPPQSGITTLDHSVAGLV